MKQALQITFIALVSLFVATACSVTSSPRSTAKHFYKAIEKGDFDQALSYTTLEADADAEIYHAIMQKVNTSIQEKGGIKKIEILREEGDLEAEELEELTVVTLISFNDGSSQEEYCDLIQRDGKWAVDVNLASK
ncbi:MAG: DUF4878 domain-containing protein [Alistipes sp.]|nr:DUF4878 domain-containing protein [Alistipes sp.]